MNGIGIKVVESVRYILATFLTSKEITLIRVGKDT